MNNVKMKCLSILVGIFFLLNLEASFSESADRETVRIKERGGQYLLTNNDLNLLLNRKTGNITSIKNCRSGMELPVLSGGIFVIDQETKQSLSISGIGKKESKNRLRFQIENSVVSIQTVALFPEHMEWEILLQNTSPMRKQLKIGLQLSFSPSKNWT